MTRTCELCENAGGEVLWEDDFCRAVWAYQPDYPGFCRVIWDKHVQEMSDLAPTDRDRLMRAVFATEQALVEVLKPDKINLASLGNVTPHLHWHVIPRFVDDPHFPNAVWGRKLRESAHPLPSDFAMRMRRALDQALKPKGGRTSRG
jgi:diadenosine tetraphosphate (Ap4A) HIT family hydrolase